MVRGVDRSRMPRVAKPTLYRGRRKITPARESLRENIGIGYSVRIQRTASGTQVWVVASPKLDIRHVLSALQRAHPDARIRISRRQ
jgi:hypothetical protein